MKGTGSGTWLRFRHGITWEPLFGYRAVREVDGVREYLGPWTTEAKAQATADQAAAITRAAIAEHDLATEKGDTVLDVWIAERPPMRPPW